MLTKLVLEAAKKYEMMRDLKAEVAKAGREIDSLKANFTTSQSAAYAALTALTDEWLDEKPSEQEEPETKED